MKKKVQIDDFGDFLTFEDVCLLLDVKRTYCYQLFKEKKIKSFKVGREYRVKKSDLLDFIDQQIAS